MFCFMSSKVWLLVVIGENEEKKIAISSERIFIVLQCALNKWKRLTLIDDLKKKKNVIKGWFTSKAILTFALNQLLNYTEVTTSQMNVKNGHLIEARGLSNLSQTIWWIDIQCISPV